MSCSPQVSEPAPDFTLPTDQGETITLSQCRGSNVVVYFYPKDDTPGCTKQAIAFTEHLSAFKAANTLIIGVSADSIAKHMKFKAKHDLGIVLASDENHDALERYGVWVEKNMYGRKYMGIERSTYLIDGDGKIAKVWRKVKVPGHVEEVLSSAKAVAL